MDNTAYSSVDAWGDPLPTTNIRPYWAARRIQNAWINAPWRNYPFNRRVRRRGENVAVRARRNFGHFRTPQNLRRASNAFRALVDNAFEDIENSAGTMILGLDSSIM